MEEKPYELPAFIQHFNKLPPDVLFHYTGQTGLLGIIGAAEFWATKIQYMNDATEFGLALRLAREWLDSLVAHSHHSSEKTACAQLKKSLDGLEEINIFSVCFCEDPDLLSQWRGYASRSNGYAIGFNSDALMQVADRNSFILGRCIYDPSVQHQIIEQAIAHCIDHELSFSLARRWGFHGPLADILFRCGVFFKDKSFEDEKEWRLISPTILYYDDRIKFRTGGSMVTPYYKMPIKIDEAIPVSYVVVGPCPHMELSKSAVTSLLMRNGIRGPLNGQQVAFASAIPFRNW